MPVRHTWPASTKQRACASGSTQSSTSQTRQAACTFKQQLTSWEDWFCQRRLSREARTPCPKKVGLSRMLDAAQTQQLVTANASDPTFAAHVELCSVPGAGVWLTAPPATDGRAIDAPLFRVALQRRLRVPIFNGDGACPCCGDPLDRFGDHALTCSCHGDRTVRHNSLRDLVFEEANDAGMRPEREKAGLLPGRPQEDGLAVSSSSRRPADVWLARGFQGDAEALDFAVTSGLTSDWYRRVATDPGAVFEHYENFKRSYKQTEEACRSQNFRCTPVVIEAHGGGWSPTLPTLADWIAGVQQQPPTNRPPPHPCGSPSASLAPSNRKTRGQS